MAPMKSSTWEAPTLCHCSSSFVSWRLPWDAQQNSIGSQTNPVTYLLPTPTCASLRRYWATIPRSISPRVCSVLRRGSGLITSSKYHAQQPFPLSLQAQCSRGQLHWPCVNLDAKIPPDVHVLIFS